MPGLDEEIDRAVLRMSIMYGHPGRTRIHYEEVAGGYIAYIEVFSRILRGDLNHTSYPVIPDEFNVHPDKLITPDMSPYVFRHYEDCRAAAEEAETIAAKTIREAEKAVAEEKK